MNTSYDDLKRFNYLCSEIEALYHNVAVKLNISDSAMKILYTICEQGDGCNQSDIYKLAGISRQTVNTAIHKLEKEGVLYLEEGQGKNKRVYLKDMGKEIIKQKIEPVITAENDVINKWSKKEREELLRLTKKYLDDFKDKISLLLCEEK